MAERPGVLRVNERVVFARMTHTVVAISGATIRLASAAGATTVVASVVPTPGKVWLAASGLPITVIHGSETTAR